jgi:hypothetical protein
MKREKWVVVRDTAGGWEGTEFNIGFEGSQALLVFPSDKLCSGNVMYLLCGTNWVFISQKTTFFMVNAVKISSLT